MNLLIQIEHFLDPSHPNAGTIRAVGVGMLMLASLLLHWFGRSPENSALPASSQPIRFPPQLEPHHTIRVDRIGDEATRRALIQAKVIIHIGHGLKKKLTFPRKTHAVHDEGTSLFATPNGMSFVYIDAATVNDSGGSVILYIPPS